MKKRHSQVLEKSLEMRAGKVDDELARLEQGRFVGDWRAGMREIKCRAQVTRGCRRNVMW